MRSPKFPEKTRRYSPHAWLERAATPRTTKRRLTIQRDILADFAVEVLRVCEAVEDE